MDEQGLQILAIAKKYTDEHGGGGGGVTPVISATATADATHKENPTVSVTKTGTDAAPSFAFAFSGLAGRPGASVALKYSLEEAVVGEWVDGTVLYQKTVYCGALPNNGTKSVAFDIDNFGFAVGISGFAVSSTMAITVPYVDTTASNNIGVAIDGSNIRLRTGSNRSAFADTYITLQYTKSALVTT